MYFYVCYITFIILPFNSNPFYCWFS